LSKVISLYLLYYCHQ